MIPRNLERRVLILAPVGKDAELMKSMLEKESIECDVCRMGEQVSQELGRGAGAVLVTEEALMDHGGTLVRAIADQPAWSDLPVLVLTRQGADSEEVGRAVDTLGNVTLLERPVRIAALATAVRSALKARERQYQTRAHFEERERLDQRKDAFLATLAHELRNPLAPIRSSLGLLRCSPDGKVPARVYDVIERQVNQMVRLVDDLMEVSRITRGKIELRKEPVDLTAVIGIAVETSRPLIDSAGHRLSVVTPAESLMLEADNVRLAQVFANLLNNAAKYTDSGGEIVVKVSREQAHVVVSVRDTGIGIAAEALPVVFDMFAQADARDSRAQTGLGIGLTLARSLVEMHGGSITAQSPGIGRGSEFIVRLPLSPDRQPEVSTLPAAVERLSQRPRVLVVDDNQDAADTLGMLLGVLGAEVRVAYDGPSALNIVADYRPGVVVLDIGMPGMSGYEVAQRIRERADLVGTQLVALTGWGQDQDQQQTREAGFAHHLIKPVDVETMQSVLSRIAGGH